MLSIWLQERVYSIWLSVDYAGIWFLLAIVPQIVQIRWGMERCATSVKIGAHLSYAFTSALSLSLILYPMLRHNKPGPPINRLMALGIQFAARVGLYIAREALGCGYTNGLKYYWCMEAISVVGGLINAARLPERWCAGKLDILVHSHQIMHTLVMGSIGLMWLGTYEDFRQHSSQHSS